jgi:hypothetical protein
MTGAGALRGMGASAAEPVAGLVPGTDWFDLVYPGDRGRAGQEVS